MPDLVFLRHGQSTWNAENRFTGWVDVDLTPRGEDEARSAGRLMAQAVADGDLADPGVVHTSLLTRAVRTANLALDEMGRSWLPVRRHWRLNERHYGALTGKNKAETAQAFGADQVKRWRRSYDEPPPVMDPSDPSQAPNPADDPRYGDLPAAARPATECLADVVERVIPYWEDDISPDLHRFGSVLVVAHGNSIRAAIKFLKGISDADIVELEVPTGIPMRFRLDDTLAVVDDRFLGNPAAAAAAAEAVARQAEVR